MDTNGDTEVSGGNDRSDSRRNGIASDMWRDFQRILEERGMLDETDECSEEELSNRMMRMIISFMFNFLFKNSFNIL